MRRRTKLGVACQNIGLNKSPLARDQRIGAPHIQIQAYLRIQKLFTVLDPTRTQRFSHEGARPRLQVDHRGRVVVRVGVRHDRVRQVAE